MIAVTSGNYSMRGELSKLSPNFEERTVQIELLKNKKPIKRLWVNDLTDESLKKGFKDLQENLKSMKLFNKNHSEN